MKTKLNYLTFLLSVLLVSKTFSQNTKEGFIYEYNGTSNSVTQGNPNKEAFSNFAIQAPKDGSNEQEIKFFDNIPAGNFFKVNKENILSQYISNFSKSKDQSAAKTASYTPCYPKMGLNVKWLTGLTYGISSYNVGCPYAFKELVVDTGLVTFLPSNAPVPGIYTTQQNYITYTLPGNQDNYTVVYRVNVIDSSNFGNERPTFYLSSILKDSIPQTPTGCHASFFMVPTDSTSNNWTIQDFSTGSDSLSYFWDFGDGNTSTQATPTHSYSAIGFYTICLTVSTDSCSDTYCSTAFMDTTKIGAGIATINVNKIDVGIKENTLDENMTLVFPNPASDEINISFKKTTKKDTYVTIIDPLGRQHINQKIERQSDSFKLNLEALQTGIYFLQIKRLDGTVLMKERIIKE